MSYADYYVEDVDLHIKGNKILDDDVVYEMETLTLRKAKEKYPNMKYKSELSNATLGIVKPDPDLGFVFYVLKYRGSTLV